MSDDATDLPTDLDKLSIVLSDLSGKQVKKLAKVLEKDRDAARLPLPHEMLLSALRPQLSNIRPDRFPNAKRIFTTPFECLLPPFDATGIQRGQIEREFIHAAWSLLEELGGEPVKGVIDTLNAAAESNDAEAVSTSARQLWQLSTDSYNEALAEVDYDVIAKKKLVKKFADQGAVEKLRKVSGLQSVAEQVIPMREELESLPVPKVTEGVTEIVKRYFEMALEEKPGQEVYVLLAMQGSLLHPADIFKIMDNVLTGNEDQAARDRIRSIIGGVVVENLDNAAGGLEELVGEKETTENEITDFVQNYVDEITHLEEAMRNGAPPEMQAKMQASNARVADVVRASVFEGAADLVKGAFTEAGGDGKPNLNDWPDEDALADAERRTKAVRDCADLAPKLAMKGDADKAVKTLEGELTNRCESVITQVRQTEPDDVESATFQLMSAIHMLETTTTPDKAQEMMERGMMEIQRAKAKAEEAASA